MANIEYVLYTCCDIKRIVVERDERDTGLRMILNFGHTIGHAYELAGNYEMWSHGQAVAAGMVVALRLGCEMGITPDNDLAAFLQLLSAFDLPAAIGCSGEMMAHAIGLDKKGQGEDITLILLERMGKALPKTLPKAELLRRLASVCGG